MSRAAKDMWMRQVSGFQLNLEILQALILCAQMNCRGYVNIGAVCFAKGGKIWKK